MRRLYLSFFLVLFCFSFVDAQISKSIKKATPAVDVPITVANGTKAQELRFGLDPAATAGIDTTFGENELPPLPPTGSFDARFVDDPMAETPLFGNGILKNYLPGTAAFNGSKTYFIFCQLESGTTFTVKWNLPAGVSGVLNDVLLGTIINKTMSGKDSLTVNKSYNTLKMTINYALDSPAKYIITPSGTTPGAGTNVTISAQLADGAGGAKAIAGKVVTWSSTGTGGSFSAATSTTNASGIATVNFTVGQTAGTVHTVTGTDNTTPTPLTGTSGNITVAAGAASKYLITTSKASVVAGDTTKVTGQLTDQYGNIVATSGKIVTWSKTGGTSGSFNPATSTTDASGKVTTVFTVSTAAVVHTVIGTDGGGLTGTSGYVTVTAGTASKYLVTSSRYDPNAGDTVKVSAQLTDQYGNAVGTSGKTVTWSKTGTGGSFASPTSSTDVNGKATVVFTTSNSTPPITHVVTATDNNSLTGSTSNIVTSAGPAVKYIVTSSRSNPVAGDTVTVTAQLADVGGNPKPISGKVVTWTKTSTGGSFSTATSTTGNDGIAKVIFTVSQVAGTVHAVTATDNSTPTPLTGKSADITVATGAASKYLVTTSKTNVVAGDTVTVTGQLADQYNNVVKTVGKVVTWSSTGTSGSFSAATSTTDANGKVTVVFTVNTVSGTVHTVNGKDTDNIEGTSGNITVIAGAPTKYIVTSSGATPDVGSNVTITAQLADVNNNAVATSGKIVTWSNTGTGGSFNTATSTTNASGIATVTFTVSQTVATVHTVTATDNTAPTPLTGTSGNITTKVGAASKYIVTSSDNNPVAGSDVTITAQLTDQFGNAVATVGKTVTWSKTGTGGTFGSATSLTNASGIATVTFTTGTVSNVTYKIKGTDDSTPTPLVGETGNIITKAGPATKYVISSSNSSPVAGAAVTISAQLTDANNNIVGTSGKTVTWISTNGGTFASPTSTTNANGLATVSFTTSATVGTTHKITGTDGDGLTGSTNPDVTTTAGPPTHYTVTASGYNPTVGTNVTITAQLADVANNSIKTAGKIVTWSKTGTGGSFSSATSTTDANGIATVTFTVSQTAIVVHKVTATDNTTPTALTGTAPDVTTKADVASKYIVTSDIYGPFIGTDVNITAQLADQFNNSIKTSGKTVTWSSTNGGTFASATSATDADGKATVKFTVSLTDGIVHTVTATDNNSLTGTSGNITTITLLPPVLVTPVNNNGNTNTTIKFVIHKVDKATSYQIQVSSASDFSSVDKETGVISDTTGTISGLESEHKYYWRARAKNAVGSSNWSTVWTFSTGMTKPYIPILLTPMNNGKNLPVNLALTWAAISNALTYSVQVSEKSDFSALAVEVKDIKEVKTQLSKLKYKQDYFWRVKAKNTIGESDYSSAWTFTTIDTILAPSELAAVVDTNIVVTLSWKDNSNNETGFKIERKGPSDQDFVELKQIAADKIQYKDSTAQQGKEYKYRVKAFNTERQSFYSNEVTLTTPLKTIKSPTNLVTWSDGDNHTNIQWQDNSNNENGFTLERSDNNPSGNIVALKVHSVTAAWVVVATLPANTTKYVDSSTKEGVVYYYRVSAFNDQGKSVPAEITKPVLLLLAPTNLAAAKPNATSVKLTWTDNSTTESGYMILKASKPSMSYVVIDSVKASVATYTDSNVLDGKSYYYQVYAYSGSLGKSASTDVSSVTFDMNVPTTLAVEQLKNENKIKLTWKDNSKSETKYLVERKEAAEAAYSKVAELAANVETYTDATVSNKKNYTYRIQCANDESTSAFVTSSAVIVGIKSLAGIPTQFELFQNYPNPFNPSTKIRYSIPQVSTVVVSIYNVIGEKIADLLNENLQPGNYEVEWNAANYASGLYIYRINAYSNSGDGSFNYVRKMLLIK